MTKILIAAIIDNENIIINKGKNDNITKGEMYKVIQLGEEVFDPETKESLGHIEIIKGHGKITNVQARMATLTSAELRMHKITFLTPSSEPYAVKFKSPCIGDLAIKLF